MSEFWSFLMYTGLGCDWTVFHQESRFRLTVQHDLERLLQRPFLKSLNTEPDRQSCNALFGDTLTSKAVSGSMITAATFTFCGLRDHSLSTRSIPYSLTDIVTTMRRSLVSKGRPRHNVVPGPRARQATGFDCFHFLSSNLDASQSALN